MMAAALHPGRIWRLCIVAAMVASFVLTACGGPKVKPDPVLIADAKRLASRGSSFYERGCYAEAERFFYQAMETSRLMDDRPAIAKARNNLGAAALARGDLKLAAEHLSKALDLNASLNNPALDSLILGNLAGLAFKSGKRDDAEDLWRRALKTAQTDEAHTGSALHQSNLGMLCRLAGRYTEAEAFLLDAQAEALASGQTGILAGVHSELGLLLLATGNQEQAEQHLRTALDLDKETENPRGIAEDLENLGQLYQAAGQWEKAAMELDQAIRLRASLAQPEKMKALLKLLQDNQSKSGKPDDIETYRSLLKETEKNGKSVLCP